MKPSEAIKNLLKVRNIYHGVDKETRAVVSSIANGHYDTTDVPEEVPELTAVQKAQIARKSTINPNASVEGS